MNPRENKGKIFISLCIICSVLLYATSLLAKPKINPTRCANYSPPTPSQILFFKKEFTQFLQQKDAFGGRLFKTIPQNSIIILKEQTPCFGSGFFVYNKQVQNNIFIQAPHAYSDLYTGSIVAKLVKINAVKLAAWNTAKRKQADLAHIKNSYLMAATKTYLQYKPKSLIIQLHGFDNAKRRTTIGKKANIILSDGTQKPSTVIFKLQMCLRKQVSKTTYIYPLDIQELGATTNTIGQWINTHYPDTFVHIELSRPLRKKLLSHNELANKFSECINEISQ